MRKRQVRIYRQIMEIHLNRKLTFNEVVHHINEDRSDNRLENLQLMTREEHSRYHGIGERNPVYGKGGTFKGKSHSEEFKLKLSKRMSGENNPMYGKLVSDEIKMRLSEASKNRPRTDAERKKRSLMMMGSGNPMYGKTVSDSTKAKMSKSHREKYGWSEFTEEIKLAVLFEYFNTRISVPKLSEKYNISGKTLYVYIRSKKSIADLITGDEPLENWV